MKRAYIREIRAVYRDSEIKAGKQIHGPEDAFDIFSKLANDSAYEELWVAYFNAEIKLICIFMAGRGSITSAAASPRTILTQALLCNAAGIVIYHNHPSGSVEPSTEDIGFCNTVKTSCKLFDIHLLDCLIGSPDGSKFSFAEHNLI